MCYDISFKVNVKEIGDYFPDLIEDDQVEVDFEKSVHIQAHAYGEHPIIYRNKDDGKLHLKLMEWSCVPYYTTDLNAFAKSRKWYANAKSHKIFGDPKSYWFKIKTKRCLIPVNAFYEHREVAGLKNKVPYHISLKKQPMFYLPGLYSVANIATEHGDKLWSFSINTREAVDNYVMRQIHNSTNDEDQYRMPLMLPLHLSELYMSADLSDEDYKMILDYEMPPEELEYYTVASIRARKPREDGKRKDEFFDWGPKVPAIIAA